MTLVKYILFIFVTVSYFFSSSNSLAQDLEKHWHNGDRFQNLPGAPERDISFRTYFDFTIQRTLSFPEISEIPEGHLLQYESAIAMLHEAKDKDSITWIGHATFIIQLGGKTILTDPFLTARTSPFNFLGPERFVRPGILLEDLPPIDIIVISHNHYDHLDKKTLDQIPKKDEVVVVTPLRLGKFFIKLGFGQVNEIDWYEEIVVDGIKITALPARHWSRRGLFDENHSLWMSAIIENSTRRIYFSGDTGYAPYFEQLGQKYGPFDIALINSGAYEPREMMRFSHTTPEEAINLGFDMRAKVLVPMAWGTVQLGTEPPFEAPQRFRAQALKRGLKPDDVWVFSIGETRILK